MFLAFRISPPTAATGFAAEMAQIFVLVADVGCEGLVVKKAANGWDCDWVVHSEVDPSDQDCHSRASKRLRVRHRTL